MQLLFALSFLGMINATPVPLPGLMTAAPIKPTAQVLKSGASLRPAVPRASVVVKAAAMPERGSLAIENAHLPKTDLADQFALRARVRDRTGAPEYLDKNVKILEKAHDELKVKDSDVLRAILALQAKKEELEKAVQVELPSTQDLLAQVRIHQEIARLEQKRLEAIQSLKEPRRAVQDATNNVQQIGFHALEQADDTPLSRKEARKIVPSLEKAFELAPAEDFMTEEDLIKIEKQKRYNALWEEVAKRQRGDLS